MEWSLEEIGILKELYPTSEKTIITDLFDRSWDAIETKACRLKIKRKAFSIIPEQLHIPNEFSAYMAGLIDGDGSIMIVKNGSENRYIPTIVFSNTDLELVNFLNDMLGEFGINSGITRNKQRGMGKKPIYLLNIKCINAYQLAKNINKYLILKKKQSEKVIEWFTVRSKRDNHKGPYTTKEHDIIKEIQELNRG